MKKQHKRVSVIGLSLVLLIFVVGVRCAAASEAIDANGVSYIVNTEEHTVSDGINLYSYTFSGSATDYEVHITLPDGSSYWQKTSGNSTSCGWSDDYDPARFAEGDRLCDIIREKEAPSSVSSKYSPGRILAAAILLIAGLLNIAAPEAAWQLSHGWVYKNAEPSDAILLCNRLGGVAALVLAAILIFV